MSDSSDIQKYLKLACEEAENGVRCGDGGPFGAVVVKDGHIVGIGHNEVLKSQDPTAHAEVVAIRRASSKLNNFNLSQCVLFSSCKPCPMCYTASLWARVDRVYYCLTDDDAAEHGFDDRHFYDLVSRHKENEQFLIHVPIKSALKAMQMWSNKLDKVPY